MSLPVARKRADRFNAHNPLTRLRSTSFIRRARPPEWGHPDRIALGATTQTTREGGPRPFPVIPGHEFSGEVLALGPGASGIAMGDEVYGMNDWFAGGAQAEFCIAPAAWMAPKPESLDRAGAAVSHSRPLESDEFRVLLRHADGALQFLDADLQVQFAHAREDRFPGLLVRAGLQSPVVTHEAVEGFTHLAAVKYLAERQ